MINPLEFMKNLENYKSQAEEFKAKLGNIRCSGYAMGNQIEAIVTGDMKIESLTIAPELVKEGNAQMVEVLVASAINNAFENVKVRMAQDLRQYTQGLGL
ncbi:MAG: YbaB/EbfC family nucleoid-associated protein [Sphaerochaetaceae bacterium]|mgnify:CR=1 FL=1|nr:YbaB/EbfC family nucleoid-associated protein [Sphaerochaetaceae bacterium]